MRARRLLVLVALGLASAPAAAEQVLGLAKDGLADLELSDDAAALVRAFPRDPATITQGPLTARPAGRSAVELEDRRTGERTTVARVLSSLVVLDRRAATRRPLARGELARRQGVAEAELFHRKSAYKTDRFLAEYAHSFGEELTRDLDALGPGHQWVDLGAGHAVAQRGYLGDARRAGRAPARLTAVALTMPPPHLDEDGFPTVEPVGAWLARERPEGFRYLVGRVETMPAGAWGEAQLVTDHHGAFYYSRRPDRVLARALGSLAIGGRFYALAPGSETHLGAWLGALEGARLVRLGTVPGQKLQVVVVERTAAKLRVPRLRLDEYAVWAGNDPVRRRMRVVEGKRTR